MERFIVLLYSCNVDRCKWWIYGKTRRSIRETLDLGEEWEHQLLDATFLSAFQIAIPLMPGLTKLDSTASVLKVLVVQGQGRSTNCPLLQAFPVVKNNITRGWMLKVVENEQGYGDDFKNNHTIGVPDVLKLKLRPDLLKALYIAASCSIAQVCHYNDKKKVEREKERAEELLKHLQRAVIGEKVLASPPVSLSHCPLQLGYSDLFDWRDSKDTCRITSRNLDALLQSPCLCGLLSWKKRSWAGECMTHVFKPAEFIGVIVHQLKEQVMQRCFLGECDFVEGFINDDSDSAVRENYTLITLDPNEIGKIGRLSSIRHHLVFVMSASLMSAEGAAANTTALGSTQSSNNPASSSAAKHGDRNLQTSVIESGEFQIAKKFEGVGTKYLRLHGRVKATGRVRVVIGEYVGPEHYTIAALRRHRKNLDDATAFLDFFGTHTGPRPKHRPQGPFHGISTEVVQNAVSRQLSAHQLEFVKNAIASSTGITALNAVAGAGKTIVVTGMFLTLIPTMGPNDRLVYLTKTRKARDKQLSEFRSLLPNPLEALSLGRQRDKGPTDETEARWDEVVTSFIDKKMEGIVGELRRIRQRLKETLVTKNMNPLSDNGRTWRDLSEEMHVLSMKYFSAKLDAEDEAFKTAKIILMTVDGFVQNLSGECVWSSLLAKYNIISCCIDEAHQLEHKIVAAVALAVKNVTLIYDEVQRIETQPRRRGKLHSRTNLREGEYFAWERCIYGGTMNPAWSTLRDTDVQTMKFTFRFGPKITTFLRDTIDPYKEDGPDQQGIWSPKEEPYLFPRDELKRVPDTTLTFISYREERFYTSINRREMSAEQSAVVPRRRNTADESSDTSPVRIAGSQNMFAKLAHEGLFFLRRLGEGQVRLNEASGPIQLDINTKAIATIFYSNDVLVPFKAMMLKILRDSTILNAYGLNAELDYEQVWSIGTPEGVSGETVLLCQVCIVPRIAGVADLLGNMDSQGRLAVCLTRARVQTSIHACMECFQMDEVPKIWKKFAGRFTAARFDNTVLTRIEAPWEGGVPLTRASGIAQNTETEETVAYGALWKELKNNIPCIVKGILIDNPQILRFHNESHPLYDTLLTVAERIINEKLAELPREEFLADDDAYDDGVDYGGSGGGDEMDVDGCKAGSAIGVPNEREQFLVERYEKCTRTRLNESEYGPMVQGRLNCLQKVPHLLRSASFIFTDDTAQVVPMVIYHGEDDEAAVEQMVDLQRLMWFCTASLYKKKFGDNEELYFMIKPHKMRVIQKNAVFDCRSERDALIISKANDLSLSLIHI